jgi:DNA (cytosine-5)-methyltransferase 1
VATHKTAKIRTLSLFAGAGGLDIGFHDAGFDICEMVEIEDRFVTTLRANCGEGRYLGEAIPTCIDICQYLPSDGSQVDFIIGGPPCQSFSAAGRRASGVQGTDDDRGKLFREYVRLLRELKPRGFLIENVYGITGAQGGKPWAEITQAFTAAGYRLSYRILDAADYGVPQHRERMFIVGCRDHEFRFPVPTHGPDSPGFNPVYTAGEAVSGAAVTDSERETGLQGRYGHLLEQVPPSLNYSFFTVEMGHPNPVFAWRSKFSDFLYKADPYSPIRTLKAQGGQYTGPFHWSSRPFAISEIKRLQTFPDAYHVVGRRQLAMQQIGNSVPPQLARVLALEILSQLFSVHLPVALPTLYAQQSLGFRKRKRLLTSVYRKKASSAHEANGDVHKVVRSIKKRSYRGDLSTRFDWVVSNDGQWRVQFTPLKGCWRFVLSPKSSPDVPSNSYYAQIDVCPSNSSDQWAVPARRIEFLLASKDPLCLTAAWKAFEQELIRHHIKADLVQLCGYYQYAAAFRASVNFATKEHKSFSWRLLQHVTEGVGVRETLPSSELAMLWGLEAEGVLAAAQSLRSLGFEVRNRQTNPQIPLGEFLVPYAFPTLTPASVQLRKNLA